MTGFFTLHPAVAAFYFVSILGVTMFAPHPILLGVALLGAVSFAGKSGHIPHPGRSLGLYFSLFVVVTATNPLFSHHGATPLFFLNGNPVTLEALLYGGNLGLMLLAVLWWFTCLQLVLTEDKLLYLFGKHAPKIGVLLSGALRFIPLLKQQASRIRQCQRAMGLYTSDAWGDRLHSTLRVYSALATWALETAIGNGMAMQGRGYGLPGRSHYSLFRFSKRDAAALGCTALLDALLLPALLTGQLHFTFYPVLTAPTATVWGVLGFAAFGALSLMPFILEIKEDVLWNYYRSKI